MISRILFCCALLGLLLSARPVQGQDYDIQRYDLNVQLQPAANTAQIQAKLAIINITTQGRSGQTVTLKINKHAKVTAVQVDGSSAQFRQNNDPRLTEIANLGIDLPKSLAPAATATLTITYSLELKESSPLATISPGETILLPESFWVPLVHTPFLPYGLDVAPVMLTATTGGDNDRIQSGGLRKANGNTISFEQPFASLPLLLSGNYDEPIEIKSGATNFVISYPRGIGNYARKQADTLVAEAGKMLEFYQQLIGQTPPAQIQIISSAQVASYVSGSTLVLSEDLFRRDTLDLETVEFLARALLRNKIGNENLPRGRGWGILQDALPAYLAGLYFEHRYGAAAGHEFFQRRARAYAPLAAAKNDGPLLTASPIDNQYSTAMFNKGPLMLHLIELQLGRERWLSIIKSLLTSNNHQIHYEDLKRATLAANKGIETFFDQWIEKISEPDFIIGIPVAAENGWRCALRNLGTGTTDLTVMAVTDKGERLTQTVSLPSQGRAEVLFKTADKLGYVEVDPDKLYPQSNYDNDSRPQATSPFTLFKDANLHFTKKAYGEAENDLRSALKREPDNTVTRTLLARTLAAENKYDEAKSEIDTILKQAPLPLYTITWTDYVLGEIVQSKNAREAVDYFRRAVAVSKDIIPVRQKLIESERQASQLPPVDDSVRNFIGQLDRALKEATNQSLEPVVNRTNLSKFMRSIITNKPDSWTTEILRAEPITVDKVAVDVQITAVSGDKTQRGTALYILRRNQNGWILNNIELFNIE